jgi:hypothetical protein
METLPREACALHVETREPGRTDKTDRTDARAMAARLEET